MSEQARRIAELESTLAGVRHNENLTQNMDDLAGNINRSDVSVDCRYLPVSSNIITIIA